jgi:hypothetical protein
MILAALDLRLDRNVVLAPAQHKRCDHDGDDDNNRRIVLFALAPWFPQRTNLDLQAFGRKTGTQWEIDDFFQMLTSFVPRAGWFFVRGP